MAETSGNNSHWIPLSDLMMGLMMVFMLLAALYMTRVEQTTTLIVKEYEVTRDDLHRALQSEFAQNFQEWDAELLGDMTIRFKNPEVLFATGSDQLRPSFQNILKDFIPRYIEILTNEKFIDTVKEVRIEGHTSTFWTAAPSRLDAYFRNMALSQARTRSTLEYVMQLPSARAHEAWLIARLTANGLSSSRPILSEAQKVDEAASQRVEFRIVTNAEERLSRIARGISALDGPTP
jgi:outer membrane protein OmpA-like peptidoglycan-associated protein